MSSIKRHIVVTGGARGIGAAIAQAFASAGDRVTILDILETGQQTADAISSGYGECLFHKINIADPESISHYFQSVADKKENVDVLINNAGISTFTPLESASADEWDYVMNTNVRGAFLCTKHAALLMPPGSAVINIASTRGLMSEAGNEAYAASKGALLALTHANANSLAKKKIRVNAISPGWIHNGSEHDLRDVDHAQHLSGRAGKPEDVANACLFLAQKENEFINGENIVIDGGMTKKMIYEH